MVSSIIWKYNNIQFNLVPNYTDSCLKMLYSVSKHLAKVPFNRKKPLAEPAPVSMYRYNIDVVYGNVIYIMLMKVCFSVSAALEETQLL